MPRLNADTRHRVTVALNSRQTDGYTEPRLLLSDFLRHELGAKEPDTRPGDSNFSTASRRPDTLKDRSALHEYLFEKLKAVRHD